MSAVVGPNGCGKSNIIDAVRWVMGDSSAKNLRGESMSDVIFNGSGGRQPVGQASIELIFDNQDGTVVGEYAAFAEISIKRLVTRAGQSDYFLNGTRCRRRDITDIFLGTGLGPRSYAIIEQGMISRLIESKPEDLRIFIEEAAGISKYKERRKETETRMRRTLENLERLQDIRDELGRQIHHLERQAQAAEQYRELKQQERDARALSGALQWQAYADQIATLAGTINQSELDRESVMADYRALEADLEQQRAAYTDSSDACNQIQANYYAVGAEVTRLEQAIQFEVQRQGQLQQRLLQAEASAQLANDSLASDEAALALAQAELAELSPQRTAMEVRVEGSTAALEGAESAMQEWQSQWEAFNQSASAARQSSELQQSKIQYLEQVTTKLVRRQEALLAELESLESRVDQGETQRLEVRLLALTQEAEALEQQRLAAIQDRESVRTELAGNQTTIADLRTRSQQVQGQLASFEVLQEQHEGHTQRGVDDWINQSRMTNIATLVTELSVSKRWQSALEQVLAQDIHGWVVDKLDVDSRSIAELPATQLYLQDRSQTSKPPQTLAAQVTSETLPSVLSSVRTAEDLGEALLGRGKLKPGESIITPDGVWLGLDWIRIRRIDDPESGALYRQEQIERLRTAAVDLENTISKQQKLGAEHEHALAELDRTLESCRTRLQSLMTEQGRLRADISAILARNSKENERRAAIEAELRELRKDYDLEERAMAAARGELAEAIEQIERDSKQREQLIELRESHRNSVEAQRTVARQDRDQLYSTTLLEQQAQAKVAATEQAIERLRQQAQDLNSQRELILSEMAQNDGDVVPQRQAELERQLEHRLEIEQTLTQARAQLSELEQAMRAADQARLGIERRRDQIASVLEAQRLERQTLTVQQATIVARLEEENWTVDKARALVQPGAELEQVQKLIESLGQKIVRLGAINLAAIDEFAAQSERKSYLDSQHEDLQSALETLEAAIRKIDKETRSRFRETFEEVNAGLQTLFPRFFGGGSAHLEMTGDDLLDTGVAIMAQPPGKKNSTIHLLSGGEKALTAIALVFSIFQLNPAPFCMLDEVDAPLDDANVGRYAKMVKEMSSKVQFIYITHNKLSMELADQLLGVTMHEPGVSRLVSVDVEEAAELAAS